MLSIRHSTTRTDTYICNRFTWDSFKKIGNSLTVNLLLLVSKYNQNHHNKKIRIDYYVPIKL